MSVHCCSNVHVLPAFPQLPASVKQYRALECDDGGDLHAELRRRMDAVHARKNALDCSRLKFEERLGRLRDMFDRMERSIKTAFGRKMAETEKILDVEEAGIALRQQQVAAMQRAGCAVAPIMGDDATESVVFEWTVLGLAIVEKLLHAFRGDDSAAAVAVPRDIHQWNRRIASAAALAIEPLNAVKEAMSSEVALITQVIKHEKYKSTGRLFQQKCVSVDRMKFAFLPPTSAHAMVMNFQGTMVAETKTSSLTRRHITVSELRDGKIVAFITLDYQEPKHLAFGREGNILASLSKRSYVAEMTLDGRPLRRYSHVSLNNGEICCIAANHDYIVVGTTKSAIALFTYGSGSALRTFTLSEHVSGSSQNFTVSLSPDGRFLAVAHVSTYAVSLYSMTGELLETTTTALLYGAGGDITKAWGPIWIEFLPSGELAVLLRPPVGARHGYRGEMGEMERSARIAVLSPSYFEWTWTHVVHSEMADVDICCFRSVLGDKLAVVTPYKVLMFE